MIRVRATRKGQYDGQRIRPGVEFQIKDLSELGSWMERLDKPGPKKKAGALHGEHLRHTQTGDPGLG
jgi:hypothetical protein